MSIYDILMLAIFIGSVLFGAWKGLAWQVASLASIIVSYVVAINFSDQLASYLQAEPPWNKFGAMLILFLGCSFLIWIVFGRIRESIKKMHLGGFDRQTGALLGAVKGALLCMVVTMFGVALLGDTTAEAICHSKSGGYITRGINQLTSVVPEEIHGVLGPYIEQFNAEMQKEHNEHAGERAPFSNQFELPQTADSQPIYGGQQPPNQRYGQSNSTNTYNGQFNPVQGQQNGQTYQTYNGQWQQPTPPQNQYPNQAPNQYPNQYQNQYPNQNQYQPAGQYGSPNNPSNRPQSQTGWPSQTYNQGGYSQTNQTPNQPVNSSSGWPSIQLDSEDLINAGSDILRDTAKRLLENGQNR